MRHPSDPTGKTRRFIIEISLNDEFVNDDDDAIAEAFFNDLCGNDYGEYLFSIDTWDPAP
jgi:hypothetical protein